VAYSRSVSRADAAPAERLRREKNGGGTGRAILGRCPHGHNRPVAMSDTLAQDV